MAASSAWRVSGTYFEACNCDAPCPCRKVGERAGGASSYDTCDFALTWSIGAGQLRDVDLRGLNVAMVGRWDNAEEPLPGFPPIRPPWHVILYVDDRANEPQQRALADIFLGRLGGTPEKNFTRLIGEVHAVKPARIELDHGAGRERMRIGAHVEAASREPFDLAQRISCGIAGHDQPGQELVIDALRVDDAPLSWIVEGRCGFSTGFDYRSDA